MSKAERHIEISLSRQSLRLLQGDAIMMECAVSTAVNGAGERQDSECTPRGRHRIAHKIGGGCAPGTVFVGRRPSGEVYSPELARTHPHRDWILTRILWLEGLEAGRNRGPGVDSLQRYIYLHGTPEETLLGCPGSHGCIRMCNRDIVTLFELVDEGTGVMIHEGGFAARSRRPGPGASR